MAVAGQQAPALQAVVLSKPCTSADPVRMVAPALPTLCLTLAKRLFASSEAVTICLYSRDVFFTAQ